MIILHGPKTAYDGMMLLRRENVLYIPLELGPDDEEKNDAFLRQLEEYMKRPLDE